MSDAGSVEQVLQGEIARLESEGYEVFLHPRAPLVPDFLGDYVPDAVATGKGKKIVLEVAKPSKFESERLKEIASRFAKQNEWELKLLLVSPTSSGETLPVQSRHAIQGALDEIERFQEVNALRAAFLLAWATLEAEGRASIKGRFDRPQMPGRLVEVLSQEGLLTPTDADLMRALSKKRNRLVHGDLGADISHEDLQWLVGVLRRLTEDKSTAPPLSH